MSKETFPITLEQLHNLLESYDKLIENNTRLTVTANQAMEQAIKSINDQKRLLTQCGTIYDLLESKENKTKKEHECIKMLYGLITHAEVEK